MLQVVSRIAGSHSLKVKELKSLQVAIMSLDQLDIYIAGDVDDRYDRNIIGSALEFGIKQQVPQQIQPIVQQTVQQIPQPTQQTVQQTGSDLESVNLPQSAKTHEGGLFLKSKEFVKENLNKAYKFEQAVAEKAKTTFQQTKEYWTDKAHRAATWSKEKIQQSKEFLKEKAIQAKNYIKDTVTLAVDYWTDKAHQVSTWTNDTMQQTKQYATKKAIQTKNWTKDTWQTTKEKIQQTYQETRLKLNKTIVDGKYNIAKIAGKSIFIFGLHMIPATGKEIYSKEHRKVKERTATDWTNFKLNEMTVAKGDISYSAKQGDLNIQLIGRDKANLNSDYTLSESQFTNNSEHHKFIMSSDNRPLAIIPAKDKPLTLEIQQALKEAKIVIVNTSQDIKNLINANTIIVACNGVGNPNPYGSSPDMINLAQAIKDSGLSNVVAPPLYTRGKVLQNIDKITNKSENVMFVTQNILKDALITNGSEMALPVSIQRDRIILKLDEMSCKLYQNSLLGSSPNIVFIGFSGGAQPACEEALYFGDKASLITLDGPMVEHNISNMFKYTQFNSSIVGELRYVGKNPQNYQVINITAKNDAKSKLDINTNHFVYFLDKKITQTVVDTVKQHLEERFSIMYDEITFDRR